METNKKSIPFIEILAILLFVVGIIFIFVSSRGKEQQEREVQNAVRFQHVSEIADALWRLSISSPEYSARIATVPKDVSCVESPVEVAQFTEFLVPQFFETLPQDPTGVSYRVSFDQEGRLTVCSSSGQDENGNVKIISITR